MRKFSKKKPQRFVLFSIFFFIISLSFLYSFRLESYLIYERIQFNSSGATLYANLFYPIKTLDF